MQYGGRSERPVLVRVARAVEMLGLSKPSVYDLIHRGELRIVKYGRATRVVVASIDEYVERHAEGGRDDA